MMPNPTFIVIGAAKAGTTSLFHYLTQHPEVFMAPEKEIHYFDAKYRKGHNWYLSKFNKSKNSKARGEATPMYCFYPKAIERIHKFDPKLKLIFLLRNPVDRAISHYWMAVHQKYETKELLEALQIDEEIRCKLLEARSGSITGNDIDFAYFSYKSRGLYHEQLDHIYDCFPKEQVLIQKLEEFVMYPKKVYSDICGFLEVSDHTPSFSNHFPGNYSKNSELEAVSYLKEYFTVPNKILFEKYGIDYR